MMRRILVDAARARGAQKRGAGAERVNAEDVELVSPEPQHFVIALDAALEEFPRSHRVLFNEMSRGNVDLTYAAIVEVAEQAHQFLQVN